MNKFKLSLVLFFAYNYSNAQFLDANGSQLNTAFQDKSSPVNLRVENNISRFITELNSVYKADAYPYLSPNGLRLYYVFDNDLYVADRPTITSTFSNKKQLFTTVNSRSNGCWLTNDELSIYYEYLGTVYFSTRKNITDSFQEGVPIKLIGGSFFSGISLTPDGNQMIVYNGLDKGCSIYTKTGNLEYTFNKILTIPTGAKAHPAQLSKDGLSLYVALTHPNTSGDKIYVSNRTSLKYDFSEYFHVETGFSANNTQPTVNSDKSILIFVNSATNSWNADELYESNGNFNFTAIETINNTISTITFYPNPSRNGVFYSDVELNDVKIYNSSGTMVSPNLSNVNSIDLSIFSRGIYYVTFSTSKGKAKQKLVLE